MFRPMRRAKREISEDLAKELLLKSRRGVFAVNGDEGYPYAIPVNFIFDKETNRIYFHGAKAGHKLDAVRVCNKVCFTVYGNETIKEEEWAPFVQSTVVFGRCHILEDMELVLPLVKKMAMKYYPNEELADEEIAKSGEAVIMYEIEIEHITGKEVQEK